MSTQDQARQLMTEKRHHNEHLHDAMLSRAEAEVNQPSDADIQEQAREHLTEQRHHDEHLHESMLNRAETEVNRD